MQMLIKEALDFSLVHLTHLLRRHGDLVAVPVPALGGELVDALDRGDTKVQHADGAQLVEGDGPA